MIFITGQKGYSLLEYNQEIENVHMQISNQIYFCRKKGQELLENKESRDVPNKNMKKTQHKDYEQNTQKTGKRTINEVKLLADNIKQATWQREFKHVPESTLSFFLPSPSA